MIKKLLSEIENQTQELKTLLNRQTFEDYLQDRCFEENQTVLDDDMPDYFDHWLSQLDAQEVMDYAEAWGKTLN